MKKIVALLILAIQVVVANAQLVDVINEVYYGGTLIPEGYTTYRIYARLQDPTDRVSAVFGSTSPSPTHWLELGSTEDNAIYNNQFGGYMGDMLNCVLWTFFPETQYDSYVTIGRTSNDGTCSGDCSGPLGTVFSITTPAGMIPSSFSFDGDEGFISYQPNLFMVDGAWFTPNDGSCNAYGQGSDNRVLIAQLTIPTGTLHYELNISIFDEGIGADQLIYVHTLQDNPGFVGTIPELDGTCMGLVYPTPDWGSYDCCMGICGDPLACNYSSACIYGYDEYNCWYPGCNDPLAMNFNMWAGCDDGSCIYEGCTDVNACNFDALASIDDGSCAYTTEECSGCTDQAADNYSDGAGMDDGSCTYTIGGRVFNDENENGFMNWNEDGIPFIMVVLSELELIVFTDSNGGYYFDGLPAGTYTITVVNNVEVWPFVTTDESLTINVPSSVQYKFGLSSDNPFYNTTLAFYDPMASLCNFELSSFICVKNNGNFPMYGYEVITLDSLLTYTWSTLPVDSVVGQQVYFGLDELMPGEMIIGYIYYITPGPEYIGTTLCSTAHVYGYSDEAMTTLVHENETEMCFELGCSYDPNDKQVFPEGYSENHFVLQDQRLEYLVRFQNTGNAPAYNITVRDTVDIDLDLSTFELITYSHDVHVSINTNSREIEFFFENIMLPDSVNNEPESHGLVCYSLLPADGIDAGTELNNTAHIYFDNNPPVVTNTVWSTIYSCEGQSNFTMSAIEYCNYQPVMFDAETIYADTYTWNANGEALNAASDFENIFSEPGEYTITLETQNPLCTVSHSQQLHIEAVPGDFNCSNDVTVNDLNLFIANYACFGTCGIFDMNDDDIVNVKDLLEFMNSI